MKMGILDIPCTHLLAIREILHVFHLRDKQDCEEYNRDIRRLLPANASVHGIISMHD